jgi:hypothetical protein
MWEAICSFVHSKFYVIHLLGKKVSKIIPLTNRYTLCTQDRVASDDVEEEVCLSMVKCSLLDGKMKGLVGSGALMRQ